MVKDIHDAIKHAKFGDDRVVGVVSGVVAGQISAFPIDFAGRPYNTFALPCERVIVCAPPGIDKCCIASRATLLYYECDVVVEPASILYSQRLHTMPECSTPRP